MNLVEGRDQRCADKCQCRPLQAPSRAESWEGAAPGAKQKEAERCISDEVAGLAQYDVQCRKPLGTRSEQIMKNWIENLGCMLRRAEVCGFRDDDRQPYS